MRKLWKRALAALLAVVLIGAASTGGALSLCAGAAAYGGTCGEAVTWSLDTSTGALTISGTGEMADYVWSGEVPWYSYRESIKTAVIESGVTSIGHDAFYWCTSLTSVTIPDSVTSIGDWAFAYCTSLTSVTIPSGVTSIGYDAFYRCTSLTSVTIPSGVTSIGDYAFLGCTSLTSVTIPSGVTSIGDDAFVGFESLTSVTIPDSVTSIGNYAFADCTSLTAITVDEQNPAYCSDARGVLFDKAKTTLIQYPAGNPQTAYAIPSGVTSIGYGAFAYCTSLTSVTIPDSVTRIGGWAFRLHLDDSERIEVQEILDACLRDGLTEYGGIPLSVWQNLAAHPESSLADVYYSGSEAQWSAIEMGEENEDLRSVAIHFPGEEPPHEHSYTAAVTTEPTCTADGVRTFTCACGDAYTESVPALGHAFGAWVVTREPTAAETGEQQRTCSRCGETETQPLEKLPADASVAIHNYTANRTVDYRTTITFAAEPVQHPIPGAQVHWFINGEDKGAGDTYTAVQVKKGFVIQAKYIRDGSVLAESAVETVNVKDGFFARLAAFFRALFGLLPNVAQTYLGVEFAGRVLP